MNRISIAISTVSLVVAGLCFWMVLGQSSDEKLAFIDNVKLYNSFKLKQELEAKLTHLQNNRQSLTDSLRLEVEKLALKTKSNPTEELLQAYHQKLEYYRNTVDRFASENEETSGEYSDQVWTQLNQYIQDFGKEHQYSLVFGTSGTGNIMHAKAAMDITDEVIAYANEKYSGK